MRNLGAFIADRRDLLPVATVLKQDGKYFTVDPDEVEDFEVLTEGIYYKFSDVDNQATFLPWHTIKAIVLVKKNV